VVGKEGRSLLYVNGELVYEEECVCDESTEELLSSNSRIKSHPIEKYSYLYYTILIAFLVGLILKIVV
jgi:predicted nucleic acid-binding Zn ribbon protein